MATLEHRYGDYVQAMCGVNGLHVEWRENPGTGTDSFEHYMAGYPQPTQERVKCIKAIYHVPGFDNELLNRDDARTTFLAFHHAPGKPAAYAWRRMDEEELG